MLGVRLIGRLGFSTCLPLFTSFTSTMFPSGSLSRWASSRYYHTTYEITAFKSLSPYDLKPQVFIVEATQNPSETHHDMLCQFLPKAAVLPHSLNTVEDQILGITCMQTIWPVEAGQQFTEKILHPMSVSHRPPTICGDAFRNIEFSNFQKTSHSLTQSLFNSSPVSE